MSRISRSPHLSLRYTERLAQTGVEPSVDRVGDSYDNALAESIIGLYKTELIARRGPWRGLEAVEFATLGWIHWYNHRRLLGPIGYIPQHRRRQTASANCLSRPSRPDSSKSLSGIPGAVQTAKLKDLRRAMRRRMYAPVRKQQVWLDSAPRGHYAWYGITGNSHSIDRLRTEVLEAWRYVLMRWSNRSRMYWPRFRALLLRFSIVPARIVHVWRYP